MSKTKLTLAKEVIKNINLDCDRESDWAWQYRNCNHNTKRMLKDFLNRVLKPEINKRLEDALK